jgi:DNA helicase-2/ATP-dependent DNA helicase PcrA
MKKFIADFHIHSKYSHATSKYMDLPLLSLWGQYKGIGLMGTGDFTHPIWQKELQAQLTDAEPGLFCLKPEIKKEVDAKVYASCKHWQRFLLTSEISTIFKRKGKCYRTHSIVLAPSFEVVEKITQRLSKIGNLIHDGRPILGMDVKDLLKLVLDISDQAMLIPAHIWTPWFGLLGSKSGFNSVHEAFEELTPHIYAVEKGLSSNYLMNARLSEIDQFAILCNSDAHSVQNLGREANCMKADLTYAGVTDALKSKDKNQLIAGIEFFPERGKYYADGHRACNIVFTPMQTNNHATICPVCRKPLTVGVLNRVDQLADRTVLQAEAVMRKRFRVVPLFDILAHELKVPTTSPKLLTMYHTILREVGSEFFVLLSAPIEKIAACSSQSIAHAIERVRTGDVIIQPGYDGIYGQVQF